MMKYLEQENLQLIGETVLIPTDTLKYDRHIVECWKDILHIKLLTDKHHRFTAVVIKSTVSYYRAN